MRPNPYPCNWRLWGGEPGYGRGCAFARGVASQVALARDAARAARDYAASDRLRAALVALGVLVEDRKDEPSQYWSPYIS